LFIQLTEHCNGQFDVKVRVYFDLHITAFIQAIFSEPTRDGHGQQFFGPAEHGPKSKISKTHTHARSKIFETRPNTAQHEIFLFNFYLIFLKFFFVLY